jgi:hypothetical protein
LLLSVHFEPHAGILSARPAPTVEQRGHPDFIILRESWCFVYLLCGPSSFLSCHCNKSDISLYSYAWG